MRAMKKPAAATPFNTLQPADLDWQEDGAPFSTQYGDVYFSRSGGLAETAHVFLDGNNLKQRWLELDQLGFPGVFTITELGFGTGLNFLSCWRLWQQTGCKNLRLHFISCEKHPMSHDAMTRALQQWPELEHVSADLLAQYPDHTPGYHRLRFTNKTNDQHNVVLDLYYGDALTMLRQQSNPFSRSDAWFLDGFSPALNPELWSEELLQTITSRCNSGSTLSSYSVTGRVVRTLKSLGFVVEKQKGFGSKRQMLFARFDSHAAATSHQKLKHVSGSEPALLPRQRTAIVIGAGLAGATVARSLAERGVQVTVLDQADRVAAGASGNSQAIVQLRLNKQLDDHCRFHIHSYLYALRFYQQLGAHASNGFCWHGCGVLTLNSAYTNTRAAADSQTLSETYAHYPETLLTAVNAVQAQSITGLTFNEDGLWQPAGGWMNPRLCCECCLHHTMIRIETGTRALSLEQTSDGWKVHSNKKTFEADFVVVANSYAAREFEQTALYPVSPLRGQVSQIQKNPDSEKLTQVICSQRYLAPADKDGQHCIGASYVKNSTDTGINQQEHIENLQKLGTLAGLMSFDTSSSIAGRAGIRGASQDYTPIAGQVPDPDLPEWRYGGAQHQFVENDEVNRLPGLYINSGHGSHGTVSCPIIAEHIAALICGEASPLPQALADVIDPVRFVHRQQRRIKLQH